LSVDVAVSTLVKEFVGITADFPNLNDTLRAVSPPSIVIPPSIVASHAKVTTKRARSSSIVKIEEVGGNTNELLDQGAYSNINAQWVNLKGAWLIHPLLIIAGKIFVDAIPGVSQEMSWTIVNLAYLALSYLMFHYVTGIPFHADLHGGAYDDLTLWEQIDAGAQYTPAKKWLFCTPIALFLISTHYTRYDPWLFAVNFSALVFVLFPKLPQLHRHRIRLMASEDTVSGVATPLGPHTPK